MYYMITFHEISKINKYREIKVEMRASDYSLVSVSFWGDKNVLELDRGNGFNNLLNSLKTTELQSLKR